MNPITELTVWVGACRYYIGRTSYAVASMADALVVEWPKLGAETRAIIRRDVEEAFAQDDTARADTSSGAEHAYRPLGHDCDRAAWETVRQLWTAT